MRESRSLAEFGNFQEHDLDLIADFFDSWKMRLITQMSTSL